MKKKKFNIKRLVMVFYIPITILILWNVHHSQSELKIVKEKQTITVAKYNELLKVAEIKNHEIQLLKTDEYVGKLARREFFLSKKDEMIFVLPEENK